MHDHLLPAAIEASQRKVLERAQAKTDPAHGCAPETRSVEQLLDYGIVVINKPEGPSSHQVSAYVQQILGIDKSGHSGTLDPPVTGVLPVALGKATRIVQALLPAGKEYVGIMLLHDDVGEDKIKKAIAKFTGTIKQLPPVRSAIKREWRKRTIYYLDILQINGREVLFRMGCEGGTYVRKWVHDVGQSLGCGAHMSELVRSKAGPFDTSQMVSLQDLADAVHYWREEKNEKLLRKAILPFESGASQLPGIWVQDTAIDSLCHGALLHCPGIVRLHDDIEKDDMVAIFSLKGELVCLGIARLPSADMLKAEKGVAAKVDVVFMPPGTYPKKERSA
jgi:H/ACA ribonucleoprotein complex subunit 4